MPLETRVVSPGQRPNTVRFACGAIHELPLGWELLPPGDAGLTRRVKAAGPTWTVKEKRGRKTFSRGVWAASAQIARARSRLELERSDPAYQRRLDAGRRRRDAAQATYIQDFEAAILSFLAFDAVHEELATTLATRVAAHATPVGSGTVARTKRIPIEARAKAAVMAWMRHKTTDYDHRVIGRVKGRRREVRRELAKESRVILARYRRGEAVQSGCLLALAIRRPNRSTALPTGPIARRRAPAMAEAVRPAARQRPASVRLPSTSADEKGTASASQTAAAQGAKKSQPAPQPGTPRRTRHTNPYRKGQWPKIARIAHPKVVDKP